MSQATVAKIWKPCICVLESKENRNQNKNEKLENMNHSFTAVLSTDYQVENLCHVGDSYPNLTMQNLT